MEALPLYFKEGQGVWCTVVSQPKGERRTVKLSLIGGWDGEAPVISVALATLQSCVAYLVLFTVYQLGT